LEAALGPEDVPDARYQPLSEQRLAELQVRPARAQTPGRHGGLEVVREQVRAEPRKAGIPQQLGLSDDPELRAPEVDRLGVVAGEGDPGIADWPPPRLAAREQLPAAPHAEVTVQHQAAVEVQDQVLPAALDPLEHAAIELARRETVGA